MLAVFLVIIGVIGIILNWPIITDGFFALATSYTTNVQTPSVFSEKFSPGFTRFDGVILLIVSVILVITLFLHTTKKLIVIRTLILSLVNAFLLAELYIAAIKNGLPFYSYSGLLFSSVFFMASFFASFLKYGSTKSLKSTQLGIPTSETQTLRQTMKDTLQTAKSSFTIKLTALDDINNEWKKGVTKEFTDIELKFGRDSEWANVIIGPDWGAVSKKHGILKVIRNTLYYEPIAKNYSYAVNDKPNEIAAEISNNSIISLVSGFGPKIKVEYESRQLSILNRKTFLKAGEIARQEFKKLQTTLKMFVVLAILGIPLLGVSAKIQHFAWMNHLNKLDIEKKKISKKWNEAKSELKKKTSELETEKSKVERLKNEAMQISSKLNQTEQKLKEMELLGETYKKDAEKLRDEKIKYEEKLKDVENQLQEAKDKLQKESLSAIINRAEQVAMEIDKFLVEHSLIIPVVTVPIISKKDIEKKYNGNPPIGSGTSFVAHDLSGRFFIITLGHVVNIKDENGTTLPSISFLGMKKEWAENTIEMRKTIEKLINNNASENDFVEEGIFVFENKEWREANLKVNKEFNDNIVFLEITQGIPPKYKKLAPVISSEIKEDMIFASFGYLRGEKRAYSVGIIDEIREDFFTGLSNIYHGFSGGPAILIPETEEEVWKVIGVNQSLGYEGGKAISYFFSFPSNF